MHSIVPQTGGVITWPSARPSIHNHNGCQFAEGENMVRLGLRKNSQGDSCDEDTRDTVDGNVLSKPVSPVGSPSTYRKNKHRNSIDIVRNGEYYSNEDGIENLSKSVPTTLPSQLYCSDESDEDIDISYETRIPNRSHSRRMPSVSPKLSKNIQNLDTDIETKKSYSKGTIPLLAVVVFLCAVAMGSNRINIFEITNAVIYDKGNFYTEISSLGEKYNIDSDSILQIQTGVSTIFEKGDAGSFIFVYNSKTTNFEQSEFNKFVSDTALAAAKYLRNHSIPLTYTVVDGSMLHMDEYGELICKYRDQLTKTGVMLVRHLEAVPSNLAMAFHYYCDEYNPLVEKSAIFFTLNLGLCPQEPDNKSLYSVIEKCLSEKWKSVPEDNIGPLLTRVVSVVIDIASAF